MITNQLAEIPLIEVKNDMDFSIISPSDDINDGAFSLVIPVASEQTLPNDTLIEGGVELAVCLHAPSRVLSWTGVDGADYRVNLDRVDIDAILYGNALEDVDVFCIILSAITGETLGVGQVVIEQIIQ